MSWLMYGCSVGFHSCIRRNAVLFALRHTTNRTACKNVIRCSTFSSLQVRYLHSQNFPLRTVVEKLMESDEIPNDYDLIYRSPMNSYIPYVHSICVTSAIGSVIGCIISYYNDYVIPETEYLVLGCLLGVINIAVIIHVLQYVMRIYIKDNAYICVIPTLVPFVKSKIIYKAGDVFKHPSKGILPWQDSQYVIFGRRVIILEYYFRKPSDYNNMMSNK